ncbi:MAG: nucleoside triphosphate pyrophosphohydrolase [bacterium]|nr:nucleoside triphosphate pyrophosphohydrolase [bacterium]
MKNYPDKELRDLWQILERLLSPAGCPWDRKQTAADIARNLIDEGHEWLEAIGSNSGAEQIEELGDVSYLTLFGLFELASRREGGAAQALDSINEKLKRRHPHIFADGDKGTRDEMPEDADAQLVVWEEVKRNERRARGESEHLLKRLPASMGALAKSHRYQERAATVGFDWPNLDGVRDKMAEELAELKIELDRLPGPEAAAGDEGSPSVRYRQTLEGRDLSCLKDELGDILFVITNLCRWAGLDAEEVAEAGNAKFLRRFTGMEESLLGAGSSLKKADLPEMEHHWQVVKQREKSPDN